MNDVSRRKFLATVTGAATAAVGAVLAAPALLGRLSPEDIIRAWKDEEFRQGLTDQQRAQLPDHPAGNVDDRTYRSDTLLAAGPTRNRGRKCSRDN